MLSIQDVLSTWGRGEAGVRRRDSGVDSGTKFRRCLEYLFSYTYTGVGECSLSRSSSAPWVSKAQPFRTIPRVPRRSAPAFPSTTKRYFLPSLRSAELLEHWLLVRRFRSGLLPNLSQQHDSPGQLKGSEANGGGEGFQWCSLLLRAYTPSEKLSSRTRKSPSKPQDRKSVV